MVVGACQALVAQGEVLGPLGSLGDPLPDRGDIVFRQGQRLLWHRRFLAADHFDEQALVRLARFDGRAGVASARQPAGGRQRQSPLGLVPLMADDAMPFKDRRDFVAEEAVVGRGEVCHGGAEHRGKGEEKRQFGH